MNRRDPRPWTVEELIKAGMLGGLLLLLILCLADATRRHAEAAVMATSPSSDHRPKDLLFPVPAVTSSAMADSFNDSRGERVHHAVDILAPRHSNVVAVADGVIARLMTSVAGGIAAYEWSADRRLVYYYAHLESYAPDLAEGQTITRGQVLGYVGTTGNAPANTPHLHFAISRVERAGQWWGGSSVNPYPLLRGTER